MEKQMATEFGELIDKITKIAMEYHKIGKTTKSEFCMLKLIKQCENKIDFPITTGISEHLQISKSAVSQMMKTLEEKKYIQREANEEDRRFIKVSLTELGNEVLKKKKEELLFNICSTLQELGEEDSKMLVSLLGKYMDILEKKLKR